MRDPIRCRIIGHSWRLNGEWDLRPGEESAHVRPLLCGRCGVRGQEIVVLSEDEMGVEYRVVSLAPQRGILMDKHPVAGS